MRGWSRQDGKWFGPTHDSMRRASVPGRCGDNASRSQTFRKLPALYLTLVVQYFLNPLRRAQAARPIPSPPARSRKRAEHTHCDRSANTGEFAHLGAHGGQDACKRKKFWPDRRNERRPSTCDAAYSAGFAWGSGLDADGVGGVGADDSAASLGRDQEEAGHGEGQGRTKSQAGAATSGCDAP